MINYLAQLRPAPPAQQPFKCVVADPAWLFGDKLPGAGRGAEKHYDVMPAADICKIVLPPIADDAHLFLWRVSAMQQEALDVARAWGFTVKSEVVWLKRTKNNLEHFGMGRHVRLAHEVCLICTRGRGAGVLNRSTRSTFTTEVDDIGDLELEAKVGRHSKKPDEFFRLVEALVPGPRLELFAREPRDGWTVIGNQVAENPQILEVRS